MGALLAPCASGASPKAVCAGRDRSEVFPGSSGAVDSEIVVKQRWEREQLLLGLARDSPDEEFAAGGLGALAVPTTVRVVVVPADPGSQCVPGLDPAEVIPQLAALSDGQQLPQLDQVRGTSSGYVRYPHSGDNGLWRSFAAVHWHGGVDFFLGNQGGHEWEVPAGPRRRVVYLLQSIAWARAAFDLQRRIIERFTAAGPFRAILGVAHTAGTSLVNLGAGWPEPRASAFWDQPTAVERHVLLLEDVPEWPDAAGAEDLALRFGARLDLAFGGSGRRHLNRATP
jgi:hypothetical protein